MNQRKSDQQRRDEGDREEQERRIKIVLDSPDVNHLLSCGFHLERIDQPNGDVELFLSRY